MGDLKCFIGCKIVKAIEMRKADFEEITGRKIDSWESHGYKVVYPDGYVSWSPKSVFESSYRLVNEDEQNAVLSSIPCECECGEIRY